VSGFPAFKVSASTRSAMKMLCVPASTVETTLPSKTARAFSVTTGQPVFPILEQTLGILSIFRPELKPKMPMNLSGADSSRTETAKVPLLAI